MQWKVLVGKRQENHEKMAEFWDFFREMEKKEGRLPIFYWEQNFDDKI